MKKHLHTFSKLLKSIKPLYYFIAGGIFLLIVLLLVGNQLYITLNPQMRIDVLPLQVSLETLQNESPLVNFSIAIDTAGSCSAICTLSLVDVSSGAILSQEQINNLQQTSRVYSIPVSQVAQGQQLVSFEVACKNKKSNLCATTNETYYKNSLITMKINQTSQQLAKKQEINQSLFQLLHLLSKIDVSIQQIIHQATQLDYAYQSNPQELPPRSFEENEIGNELDKHKVTFTKLLETKATLLDQWKSQDYFSVDEVLINKTQQETTLLFEQLHELYSQQEYLRVEFNEIIKAYGELNNLSKEVTRAHKFYELTNNQEKLSELNLILSSLNTYYEQIERKSFSSYDELYIQTISFTTQLYNFIDLQIADEFEFTNNLFDELDVNQTNVVNRSLVDYCSYLDTVIIPFNNKTNTTNQTNSTTIIDEQKIYCMNSSTVYNFSYDKVKEIEFASDSFEPTLSIQLPINAPQCCFQGSCQACCDDDSCKDENYPIIFLHGHSFNKANSPEDSLIAFAKMQKKLVKEGYVDAGQLSAESALYDLPEGEWGRLNNPFTVRATYYYITFYDVADYEFATQKTEKIENYALRLRELIEVMKYKTGKDKVVIVAHSMGGLVSREYLSIFGEDSVDKLIMVGTPNLGISGSTDKFCAVVGASKECDDMSEGSIFLRRLNSDRNIPTLTDFYTIRGSGCEMQNGIDGDGIVKASNVPLSYATNYKVKGKCTDTLQTDLHGHLMDPDRYPQVYELIVDILES